MSLFQIPSKAAAGANHRISKLLLKGAEPAQVADLHENGEARGRSSIVRSGQEHLYLAIDYSFVADLTPIFTERS
jgi:hypothetical protein